MNLLVLYRKFPKYSDTQSICCNHAKIWTMLLYHRLMSPNDADGMANSVDPDQTAPLGAVWSGSALFAQTCLSENITVTQLRTTLPSVLHQSHLNTLPKKNIGRAPDSQETLVIAFLRKKCSGHPSYPVKFKLRPWTFYIILRRLYPQVLPSCLGDGFYHFHYYNNICQYLPVSYSGMCHPQGLFTYDSCVSVKILRKN